MSESGSGEIREPEKAYLREIIARLNELFEGDVSDEDKLVYVNSVLRGKLLQSAVLEQQATNNSKEQFANSPDFSMELMNAIMDALTPYTTMSRQALDSERVRDGLKEVLLGPAKLYEALRERGRQRAVRSGA